LEQKDRGGGARREKGEKNVAWAANADFGNQKRPQRGLEKRGEDFVWVTENKTGIGRNQISGQIQKEKRKAESGEFSGNKKCTNKVDDGKGEKSREKKKKKKKKQSKEVSPESKAVGRPIKKTKK